MPRTSNLTRKITGNNPVKPIHNENKLLLSRLFQAKKDQLHLQKMRVEKFLLGLGQRISIQVRDMQRHRKKDDRDAAPVHEENPDMEAEHGRQQTGGHIEGFVKRLWDATHDRKTVEKVLQPTTREEKIEAIQKAEGERNQRASWLSELSKTSGYERVVVPFFQKVETTGYFNIRHPQFRKDVSLDYYLGFNNGQIALVESFRKLVYDSLAQLERFNKRESENALRNKETGK